ALSARVRCGPYVPGAMPQADSEVRLALNTRALASITKRKQASTGFELLAAEVLPRLSSKQSPPFALRGQLLARSPLPLSECHSKEIAKTPKSLSGRANSRRVLGLLPASSHPTPAERQTRQLQVQSPEKCKRYCTARLELCV